MPSHAVRVLVPSESSTIAQRWQRTPIRIGEDTDWSYITGGAYHSCGIRTDGSMWCWGDNEASQSGDKSLPRVLAPTRMGTRSDWVSVRCGLSHSCGLTKSGALWCWGASGDGQLGGEPSDDASAFIEVPISVLAPR